MPRAIPEVLNRTPIAFAGDQAGLERFFRLEDWQIRRPDGSEDHQIVWRRGDFVVVIALTLDGELVCIEEYKQAAQQVLLGLPAGGVQKGEDPIAAALRELRQETGYAQGRSAACRTNIIGPLYNSPDKSTERHFVIVVTGVIKVADPLPEASETILAVHTLPYDTARERLPIALHQGALAVASRYLV